MTKRPALQKPPRRYHNERWNDPEAEMELFVAPWIKRKLGLHCRTTVERMKELGIYDAERHADPEPETLLTAAR
jgi:hypothetical protein